MGADITAWSSAGRGEGNGDFLQVRKKQELNPGLQLPDASMEKQMLLPDRL